MLQNFRALILGAPGSGKGTISTRIIRKFDLKHIASGDLLRSNVVANTPLGKRAESFMNKGKLVPDDLMVTLIMKEIDNSDCWMLDGFPRTLNQAKILDVHADINAAINLVVPFEVIVDRIQSRWVHIPSGRVYNTGFNPPKVAGIDDVTGEPLTQREDDKPKSVRRRLAIYSETIGPVLEFYSEKGLLEEFTGETSDEIWPLVCKFLIKATTESKREIVG